MGRISAAFGLGFAVGPAIGGLLAGGTTMADANLLRPAVGAAAFSFLAFSAIFMFLPEPVSREPHLGPAGAARTSTFQDIARVTRRPVVSMMLVLALIVITFMAVRESIFALWSHYQLGLNARELGMVLGFGGALISLIQFTAMGWLSERYGELNLIKAAIALFGVAWAGLTLTRSLPVLFVAVAVQSCGVAFFQTSMQSLLSKRAGGSERGLILGVYQSSSALARFLGQAGSGTMFGQIGMNAPFLIGAAAMVPAMALARRIGQRLEAVAAAPAGSADPARAEHGDSGLL
jgi:predicted MFS family arabinose efflux permease